MKDPWEIICCGFHHHSD